MNDLLLYSLKSVFVLLLLYAPYTLLLRKEHFFRTNRIILLSILVLSLVLPLCNFSVLYLGDIKSVVESIETSAPVAANVEHDSELKFSSMSPAHDATEQHTAQEATTLHQPAVKSVDTTADWTIAERLGFIYIAGLCLALLFRLWQLFRMEQIMRHGCLWKDKQDGITIYCHAKDIAPYSWLNKIAISKKDYDTHQREILLHEKGHILCRHSSDILLLAVVQTVQWFNPFVYMFANSLRDIHEYEADDYVLRQGVTASEYQMLLLKTTAADSPYTFANSLNHSKLKNRIIMMKETKTSPWMRCKALYILPLALIALCAFASPATQEKPAVTPSAKPASAPATDNASANAAEENTVLETVATESDVVSTDNMTAETEIAEPVATESEVVNTENEPADDAEDSATTVDSDNILYVFEGQDVNKKEFKKLWKERFNNDTYVVLGINKDIEKHISKNYLPHVHWLETHDWQYPQIVSSYTLYDEQTMSGALIAEKKNTIYGDRSHPFNVFFMTLKSKEWRNAVQNIEIQSDSTCNFVLSGTVTEGLRDVAYMINIEDEDGDIDKKPAAVVLIKDGKFTFRTKLESTTKARIRAVLDDGSLCEAFIEQKFSPGYALHLLIMDNQFGRVEKKLQKP